MRARTAGIRAQLATVDQDWPAQFHFFDRGVAYIALADRNTGGFAIARGPAAPSSSFDALGDEGPLGTRVVAKENHWTAQNAHVGGRQSSPQRGFQCQKNSIYHCGQSPAPRGH